jgi:hypothetical protein
MKQLVLLVFLVCTVACTQVSSTTERRSFDFPAWLQRGHRIPDGLARERSSEGFETIALIESNNFYALYPIVSREMEVKVLTHQSDEAQAIQGILTDDPQCETPEGISPGSKYGDIKHFAPGVPRAHYGWGHFWSLPSGWVAVFAEGGLKEESLTDESRVVELVAYGTDRKLHQLRLNKRPDQAPPPIPHSRDG